MKEPKPDPAPQAASETDVDEVLFEQADFEQKLMLLWERNRNAIITTVVVAALLIIGYHGAGYMAQRKEAAIRDEYSRADNIAARLSFAVDHPDHPLAGYAYLEVANEQYTQGEYLQAAEHYQTAIDSLEGTPLQQRARLGYAMAAIRNNDRATGQTILKELANDTTILDATRAEAAYNLAILHWQDNDLPTVKAQLDLIAGLDQPGYWINKADGLRARIPNLP